MIKRKVVTKRQRNDLVSKRVIVISVITALIFIGGVSGLTTNHVKLDCLPNENLNLLNEKGKEKIKKQ